MTIHDYIMKELNKVDWFSIPRLKHVDICYNIYQDSILKLNKQYNIYNGLYDIFKNALINSIDYNNEQIEDIMFIGKNAQPPYIDYLLRTLPIIHNFNKVSVIYEDEEFEIL